MAPFFPLAKLRTCPFLGFNGSQRERGNPMLRVWVHSLGPVAGLVEREANRKPQCWAVRIHLLTHSHISNHLREAHLNGQVVAQQVSMTVALAPSIAALRETPGSHAAAAAAAAADGGTGGSTSERFAGELELEAGGAAIGRFDRGAEMNMLLFPLLVLKGIDFSTGHISVFCPGEANKWSLYMSCKASTWILNL